MHQYDEVRLERLLALARERYKSQLEPEEERVLRESCSTDDLPEAEGEQCPRNEWQGPLLCGAFLRWIVTDPDVPRLIYSSSVSVSRVRFDEEIDFFNLELRVSLYFHGCFFEKKVDLSAIKMEHLVVKCCTFAGDVIGTHMRMRGSLIFRQTVVHGWMRLDASHIEGQFELEKTEFTRTEMALSLRNAVIGDSLDLTTEFKSAGGLDFLGVRVGGYVVLSGAKLCGLPYSLNLDGARIQGYVVLNNNFEAAGMVSLTSAQIGHSLLCDSAKLTAVGVALTLDACEIVGHARFQKGFQSYGEIQMRGARIGRDLLFSSAELTHEPFALIMDNATIGGDCSFTEGFVSAGQIYMLGGKILGNLNFSTAKLTGTGTTLQLNNVSIQGDAYFNEAFLSAGTVNLSGMDVRGMYFLASKLHGAEWSLLLHRANIRNTLHLDEAFQALGKIVLHSTTIGGQFVVGKVDIQSLKCQNSSVKELYWKELNAPQATALNLTGTHITLLRDEEASWPAAGNLTLTGLTIDEIQPLTPKRLKWLGLQPIGDLPEAQAWVHIAKHLREKGYTNAAKHAIFELRRHQARARHGKQWYRHGIYVWRILVAMLEERPQRILLSVIACVLIGTSVFWPYRAHFSETSDSAYSTTHQPKSAAGGKSGAYPRFQPIFYALENTLPIVHLGQDERWAPDKRDTKPWLYWTLAGTRWFLILAGWAQGIVLAAALDARFRS